MGDGTKCEFTRGYYLTKEYAKLAALAVYVRSQLDQARSSLFWERLFSRPISTLYPIDNHWSDSIAVKADDDCQSLPIAVVIRHPHHGVIFIDLHQLAYKDMDDSLRESLQISENIDYCSTVTRHFGPSEPKFLRTICVSLSA
jgi:hypothetical protein